MRLKILTDRGCIQHIDKQYHDELSHLTFKIPSRTLTSINLPTSTAAERTLPVATVGYQNPGCGDNVVLHPNYPALEPFTDNVTTIFRKRFGVPFRSPGRRWYSRHISSHEILCCYSVRLQEPSRIKLASGIYNILDACLPGCLPHQLARCAAQSIICTNILYNSFSYASDDYSTVAACCLHTALHSSLLDRPSAYDAETYTAFKIAALAQFETSAVLPTLIQQVHMGYRSHITKWNIVFLHGKLLLFRTINMDSTAL